MLETTQICSLQWRHKMNNYIQHTIPPPSWARYWRWTLTEEQKLWLALKEQEMLDEQQRLAKLSEQEAMAEVLGNTILNQK